MRQFAPSPGFRVGGMPFRIRPGSKGPLDLVLDWWTPDGWRPVEMQAIGMVHAFICENEDHLFPPPRLMGAEFWRAFLRLCEQDWQSATTKLAQEKAYAERQRRAS